MSFPVVLLLVTFIPWFPTEVVEFQQGPVHYDVKVLQEMWCRTIREDTADIQQAVEFLGGTGGWFSIRALQRLLLPQEQIHYERALPKTPGSDVVFLAPRTLALDVLGRVAPSQPCAFSLSPLCYPGECDILAAHA